VTAFKVGVATDTGRVRSNNQDSNLVADSIQLFAVADGMGGHQGGEVASALAIQTLESSVTAPTQDNLVAGVKLANSVVFEKAAADPDLRGMGTTLCAIFLVEADGGEEIAWVNVGDSRIYLLRDSELMQLSTDHSLVEDLRRDGQLTDEEAAVHPQRNIVTRAVGIDPEVQVDSNTVIPYEGDRFLLCSDGLFDEVGTDQITATLDRVTDPTEAADALVHLANDHGGRDNITCVLVDIIDDGGRPAAASKALADDEDRTGSPPTRILPVVEDDADCVGAVARSATAASGPPPVGGDLPFGRSTNDFYGDLDRVKRRHITWRVVGFLLAVAVVLGVAFGAIGWYAKRTYFVDFNGTDVAIYQGQPGGLLVFDPELKAGTGLMRSELTDAERQAVSRQPSFGSLTSARTFTRNLEVAVADRQTPAAPTSTGTTATTGSTPTTPSTTPTTRAGGATSLSTTTTP